MARPIGAAITRANDQIARFTRFYATVNEAHPMPIGL